MTTATTQGWMVTVQNRSDKRVAHFANFKVAYNYYLEQCDDKLNDGDIEQTTGAEMELCSGGRGHDYTIELLQEQD